MDPAFVPDPSLRAPREPDPRARLGERTFPRATAVLRAVESAPELRALISTSSRANMAELASGFPVAAQTICYECWLGEGNERVDLALCLFPGFDSGPGNTGSVFDSLASRDPAWARCLQFLKRWEAPGSSLWPRIPFTWVAFDLDRPRSQLPAPCLGLCVERDFLFRRNGSSESTLLPASSVEEVAAECCPSLLGEPLPDTLRRTLSRCDEASVEGVKPKHLSFMYSRSPRSFKLDVELPLDSVSSFLKRLGWPRSTRAIEAAIRSLMPWEGSVQLNLVLHPELSPVLEVEFLTLPSEASSERRFAFAQKLVVTGLAASAKVDALHVLSSRPLVTGPGEFDLARSWYVKVRFRDELPFEAKAYVGIMPCRPSTHEM